MQCPNCKYEGSTWSGDWLQIYYGASPCSEFYIENTEKARWKSKYVSIGLYACPQCKTVVASDE